MPPNATPTNVRRRQSTAHSTGKSQVLTIQIRNHNQKEQMRKPIQSLNSRRVQKLAMLAALAAAFGAGVVQAQRPLGVDVSSYQGSPNWSSVRSSGITFAWAKATEGVSINDSSFTYNENNGKAAGVYMGAYHFAHPNANSPGSESGHFWSIAGGYIKADGKTLMPVLDFEVFSGITGASSYSDWANQWCDNIVGNANSAGVPVKPVVYTSACSACSFDGSVAHWIPWIANYNGQGAQSGSPWSSCGGCNVWGGWDAWQYSSSGSVSGISGSVDVDVFNGTSAGLVSTLVIGTPTSMAPGPNAVSWGNNRIDVVCRGGGNSIYHKYWDGGSWQPSGHFEDLGGVANYGAGISSWDVNRLDAFTIGTDNSLQHRYFDGTGWYPNGNWENLGGTLNSSPAAVSWGVNRIDVVVRGGNNNIYHKYFDGTGWQPNGYFENIGGTSLGPPAICSWASGRLDVFIRGGDNALWHNYYTGGAWAGWQSLGGTLTSGPAAVSWASGRIDVVVRGGSNHVYHKYYVSGQGWLPSGGFEDLGGTATSDPGISSWATGRLDVFCRGTDNSLQHNYYTGGGTWAGWQSLGGVLQ